VSEFEGKGRQDHPSQQNARREEQGWADRPHADLVRAFRGLIWQKRQTYGELASRFPPAHIVRSELLHQENFRFSPKPEDKQRAEFFHGIRHAFDAIAWEHYQWRSGHLAEEQISARWDLSVRHFAAKDRQEPHPEMIRLDPQQVRILDALAEAADVPHQSGQSEITIPDHLRRRAEESLREAE
jgi:hypothetical protein